ncbi:MAG: NAD(P)H-dependent oxidoreductase [Sphingomonadales bacterium]|nr:NAD(P)H-dependent oxidoreductase [Sphingomonadales bacterium]
MTRLLLVCGSQRRASLNGRLLDAVSGHVPGGVILDRLRGDDVDLPLFDQDREHEPALLDRLRPLHARFVAADALIVASPEYNGLMTPFLKNLIDWVSRLPRIDPAAPDAFVDRPVLLLSATPGWSGGGLGIAALRALFGHVGAIAFGETICLPYAADAWDESGAINPLLPTDHWGACVRRFCAFAARPTMSKDQAA